MAKFRKWHLPPNCPRLPAARLLALRAVLLAAVMRFAAHAARITAV
ncbi:MAG TPA: hypothetical protein VI873_00830 [Candidatus Peribacteraceae bacterium]|nr:hypothetical protein [Candidatus Peribacteraceae bacterium]